MKKKSLLWSLLAVMMVTLLSVGLSSCKGDDEEVNQEVKGTTWKGAVDGESLTLIFTSNNSGTFTSVDSEETITGSFTCNGSADKGAIKIVVNGRTVDFGYYAFKGNKMYLYNDADYKELIWTLTKQ